MIFILHYLLLNAGLPAIIILLALFLQTHSDASLSEIGALLMVLPFVSILIKPLFCALADRHQAHRLYLIIMLVLMSLGYGSLTIAPFFPDFTKSHGRLVWYLDIVGIVVGFSAFGVIWSLGDALAMNHAQMHGRAWGFYRVWGVVSWGIGGILIGQINEVPFLPKYVPAMFLMCGSLLAEALLLAFWPNKHFVMGGSPLDDTAPAGAGEMGPGSIRSPESTHSKDTWSSAYRSSVRGATGSVRASPRMIGAVASAVVGDLSGTLRSSLKMGAADRHKRAPLDEIFEQHQLKNRDVSAVASNGSPTSMFGSMRKKLAVHGLDSHPLPPAAPASAAGDLELQSRDRSRSTLRRKQLALSNFNSLSAASGNVIAQEITFDSSSHNNSMHSSTPAATPNNSGSQHNNKRSLQRQPVMYMSSLASHTSLSKASAARASIGLNDSLPVQPGDLSLVSEKTNELNNTTTISEKSIEANGHHHHQQQQQQQAVSSEFQSADQLQLLLVKLIVRGDKAIWKYLVMFTIFGALLICHLSYFFVHLEKMCSAKGVDFALVTGAMVAAHAVSEVCSFSLVVPYLVPLAGRTGSLVACAVIYATRFAYYGFYLDSASPYTAVPFELAHGIVYGVVYSLITDIACESVNQVDVYFPELIERGLVDPSLSAARLKLQLRATMQGFFSGAFDGLGNGIGALLGGLFLDAHTFANLWSFCFYVCIATLVLMMLFEWRALCGGRRPPKSELTTKVVEAAAPEALDAEEPKSVKS